MQGHRQIGFPFFAIPKQKKGTRSVCCAVDTLLPYPCPRYSSSRFVFMHLSPFRNRFAKIYDILVVALLGLNEQIYLRVVRRLL